MLQGKNGYLSSIGWKGRFLQVKCKKNRQKERKGQAGNGMAGNPSANTVRVYLQLPANNMLEIKKPTK